MTLPLPVKEAPSLLPCPFCGGEASFHPYKRDGLTLKCATLGCVVFNQRTLRYSLDWLRERMVESWNTRAALASQGVQEGPSEREGVSSSPVSNADALKLADELEIAIMEVLNGERKPGKLPVEPMVKLCQFVRDTATPQQQAEEEGAVSYDEGYEHGHADATREAAATPQPTAMEAKPASIRIDFKQATDLLAMFGGEPSEITLRRLEDGHDGPGLYAHYTDSPEEGSINLGVTDEEAEPTAVGKAER